MYLYVIRRANISQFSYQVRETTWCSTNGCSSILKISLREFSLRFWPDYGWRRQMDKTPDGNRPLWFGKAVMVTWLGFLNKGIQKIHKVWKLDRRDSWFKEQLWHYFLKEEKEICVYFIKCVYAGTKIKIKPKMHRLRMSEVFLGRRHSDAGRLVPWHCFITSAS